jgi:hypothetical protein
VVYVNNPQQKKAVRVSLGLRYQKEEHELYPTYGWLYSQGYLHADRGEEVLWLLSEPAPQGTELGDDKDVLADLGYEVADLELVKGNEGEHFELVVL